MAWVFLIIAGFCEIGFVIFMKLSEGFTRKGFSVLTIITALLSFYFLSKALMEIPVGTGYGVWTGIGAAGSVLAGMFFFGESKRGKRLVFIGMVIVGVIGLKLIGG